MSFVLASAARATTGARAGQEDAFRLWPAEGVARPNGKGGGLLAVLADGMGGHTGGAVAGQTACSTFAEAFSAATTPYEARLQSALNASNEALAKGVEQNAALKGMGCTLIGAWMDEVGLRWTSVGNSLLLLYRFPDVMRLNADHSLGSFLDEQARQNRITFSEAKQHHNRNALRSALTGSKIDLVDLRGEPLELRAGDWILLASDGICSLEGDEIADVVYNFRESSPAQMADGLIAAVVKKAVAGQDNTTVVAVRVDEASDASDAVTTRVMRRPGRGAGAALASHRHYRSQQDVAAETVGCAFRAVRRMAGGGGDILPDLRGDRAAARAATDARPGVRYRRANAAAARRGDGARTRARNGRYTRARWPEGAPPTSRRAAEVRNTRCRSARAGQTSRASAGASSATLWLALWPACRAAAGTIATARRTVGRGTGAARRPAEQGQTAAGRPRGTGAPRQAPGAASQGERQGAAFQGGAQERHQERTARRKGGAHDRAAAGAEPTVGVWR